jgi:hypothetical protein
VSITQQNPNPEKSETKRRQANLGGCAERTRDFLQALVFEDVESAKSRRRANLGGCAERTWACKLGSQACGFVRKERRRVWGLSLIWFSAWVTIPLPEGSGFLGKVSQRRS